MRIALALCVLLAPLMARATTVRLLTEEEMTRHAATIVRGTVEKVSARKHPSGVIVTDVVVRVERLLKGKGQSTSTLHFTQLGGTLDGETLSVPGTSHYTEGENVLIFLEQGGESLVELGIGAGKYRITTLDGVAMVERALGGVTFARLEGKRATIVPPPAATGPEPLADFESRILVHLGQR